MNCVITSRETTCYLSLWKQEFIVISFWNMSRVYKQGRKKIKLKHRTAFLPSEDDPYSFSYPKSIFHSITLKVFVLSMSCYFLKFYWFISCIVQWLKSSLFFLVCIVLTHCIHQKKDLWWFICLEEGVTFCSVFAACILVHSSISNDISLFILHFPNLIAMKSYARVLVFSYWICKSNWKNKKQRLEFPLNLAVSKKEETEQGSKWWNIFVKSRVCWNRIWSVFFSNSPSAF